MSRIVMTYQLAMACAQDAAWHQARVNHRSMWNREDYNLACRTLAELYPKCGANLKAGLVDDPYSPKRLAVNREE